MSWMSHRVVLVMSGALLFVLGRVALPWLSGFLFRSGIYYPGIGLLATTIFSEIAGMFLLIGSLHIGGSFRTSIMWAAAAYLFVAVILFFVGVVWISPSDFVIVLVGAVSWPLWVISSI